MAGYHYLYYKRLNTVWGVGGGGRVVRSHSMSKSGLQIVWLKMIVGVRCEVWGHNQWKVWGEDWSEMSVIAGAVRCCESTRNCPERLWAWPRPECRTPVPVIWPISCWISPSLLLTCLSSLSRYSQLTELTMKCSIKHLGIHSPPSVDIQHDLKQFQLEN